MYREGVNSLPIFFTYSPTIINNDKIRNNNLKNVRCTAFTWSKTLFSTVLWGSHGKIIRGEGEKEGRKEGRKEESKEGGREGGKET